MYFCDKIQCCAVSIKLFLIYFLFQQQYTSESVCFCVIFQSLKRFHFYLICFSLLKIQKVHSKRPQRHTLNIDFPLFSPSFSYLSSRTEEIAEVEKNNFYVCCPLAFLPKDSHWIFSLQSPSCRPRSACLKNKPPQKHASFSIFPQKKSLT